MSVFNGNPPKSKFLLVEPISKTPYPPLGLMKIASMLKDKHKGCEIYTQVGNGIPERITSPDKIFITSLFTWDCVRLIESIKYYRWNFSDSEIVVGGIAASLLQDEIYSLTGIKPHIGLYDDAEFYPPDYSYDFGRSNLASITFTTRGCVNSCPFCNVRDLEPRFFVKQDWEKDVNIDFPSIVFWDNNFLASPNFARDCQKILSLNKRIDFNQGLDPRLLDEKAAKQLFKIHLDPIRFSFDGIGYEDAVVKSIRLAKKYSGREIAVYVLYNYQDTPEELYYRIDLLNREGALAFPMEYRFPSMKTQKLPGPYWNTFLLRAFKLTLLFYYRKGMITESRESFLSIYGHSEKEFISRLYDIYNYDKSIKRAKKSSGSPPLGSCVND
ncbi:MAG: hypothetical protein ABSF90_21270 [Syntrophobacteraceae bacterium]|jgi:hypothetical protein